MIKMIILMLKMIFLIFHNLILFYGHLMTLIHQKYNFLLLLNEISIYFPFKNAYIEMTIFINSFYYEFY